MKKTGFIKILAVLLAFGLLLGALPVFAESPDVAQIDLGGGKYRNFKSLQSAVDFVPAEQSSPQTTIKLLCDHEENIIVEALQNISLDLNQKTLTGICTAENYDCAIINRGDLVVSNGTMSIQSSDPSKSLIAVSNSDNLTLDHVSVSAVNTFEDPELTSTRAYAVDSSKGNLVLTDSNLYAYAYSSIALRASSSVQITDSVLKAGREDEGKFIDALSENQITVYSGTFYGQISAAVGSLVFYGGTVYGDNPAEYVAPGCKSAKIAENCYIIGKIHKVNNGTCEHGNILTLFEDNEYPTGAKVDIYDGLQSCCFIISYFVYKADDQTVSIPVDGHTFVMPDFNVTLGAVSERAGDIDNNGTVNSTDALLILKYSVSKCQFDDRQILVADVDDNSVVNSSDAQLVLSKSSGKRGVFPLVSHHRNPWYYT